jgi:glycosyltransferase involved in cell wall biosynthesis
MKAQLSRLSKHARVRRWQSELMGMWLRAFPDRVEPGTATVGVAYYRTPRHLKIQLARIRKHSDPAILRRVIVVDNHSGDGVAKVHENDVVQVHEFPQNFGHGAALDWAAWYTETEFFIALDSDAWPVSNQWLARLLNPLREGAAIAGIRHERDFIHPSCLAIRTGTLRRLRLSFSEKYPAFPMRHDDPDNGRLYWDTGERISWVLKQRGEPIERIFADRPDQATYVGSVYGGVVYHQWYGTRLEVEPGRQDFDGIPREAIEREMNEWMAEFEAQGPR